MQQGTQIAPTTTSFPTGVVIGLDLGDRWSRFCMLDNTGTVVREDRVRSTGQALGERFGKLPTARFVIETGTHSPWVSRSLTDMGHAVVVANARKLRMIYENDRKNDRLDARMLARLGRADVELLAPVRHRGAKAQADLAVVRGRDALVSARTQLINACRGMVKAMGGRLPKCTTGAFAIKAKAAIPSELQAALRPLMVSIRTLSEQIERCDQTVRALAAKRYPQTKLLQQVQGVGPLVALTYVLTLEDPRRFSNSRAVGSYLGLCPRQSESGDNTPQLRVTKAGSGHLRRLLVQSSQYILSSLACESRLRQWGLNLASRGGKNAKKRAVIAVARKLAVLLHKLWVTGEAYEPMRGISQAA